jgi:cytochrome c biogenesis protein ResB
MDLIWAGAIITVLGLLLRTFIGSQRVWLEETAEGCRVRFVGGEDVKRLRTED